MAFGSQFPLLFIRLADLDVSILIILIIIFIFVIIPFITLVKSAITRLLIGSLIIVLICTAPLVATAIPSASAQATTNLSYTITGPFTIIFEAKTDPESNEWWELDFDRAQVKIFLNGSFWNRDNLGNPIPSCVEWGDTVFGTGYNVLVFTLSIGCGMHPTFKLDYDGSVLRFDLVDFDDYSYILCPLYEKEISFTYSLEILIEISVASGDNSWSIVELLTKAESLGGTFSAWAHFFKVAHNTWQAVKSVLPPEAQAFLDTAEAGFSVFVRFVIDIGTFIVSFGFTFYSLAWIWKITEALTKLDPSILIDFINTQMNLIIAIYNFLAGLIRTIISLIKWW